MHKLQVMCQKPGCNRVAFGKCGDKDGNGACPCILEKGCGQMLCELHICAIDQTNPCGTVIQTLCKDGQCYETYKRNMLCGMLIETVVALVIIGGANLARLA